MNDIIWVSIGCVIFRIVNVLFIQTQFDPDEFWQNLEPSYCYVFGEGNSSCPGLTWEWKRQPTVTIESISDASSFIDVLNYGTEGPVRSFTSVVLTMVYYKIIQNYGLDSSWMVSRGPVFLNAILVAAPTDVAVWYMSQWMSQVPSSSSSSTQQKTILAGNMKFNYAVYCSLSSWFNAYALIRTYSNSLETVLTALSVALVSPVRHELSSCTVSIYNFENIFPY